MYGYHKVHCDLRELGERCGKNRVWRLMKQEGLQSQSGYRRRAFFGKTKPAMISPNHLQQQFDVMAPNTAWVRPQQYLSQFR